VKGAVTSEPHDDAASDRVAAGGTEGFDVWYRSQYSQLVHVLEKVGAHPAYSEEIAAEAFSRALERWDRVSQMDSPTGWTYQVAFNLLRRRHRRAASEIRALLRISAPQEPEAGQGLWDQVRRLPDRQREAVALHYLLDLPYETVANIMGVAEGTVAATLSSARKRLAEALAADTQEADR
jgi:RNA polymerase sigma factor (sigma-70 family)